MFIVKVQSRQRQSTANKQTNYTARERERKPNNKRKKEKKRKLAKLFAPAQYRFAIAFEGGPHGVYVISTRVFAGNKLNAAFVVQN